MKQPELISEGLLVLHFNVSWSLRYSKVRI